MKNKNAIGGISIAVALQLGILAASAQTNKYLFTGYETNITLAPGTYNITAYGAQGGNCVGWGSGGLGTEIEAQFYFPTSTTLNLLIGGKGGDGTSSSGEYWAGGGGGGTFVVRATTPLVVASGGGGGAFVGSGGIGTITNGGNGSAFGGTGGSGATGGNGGGAGCPYVGGGGGGGYIGNGSGYSVSTVCGVGGTGGGSSYLNGGTGGNGYNCQSTPGSGGFGGGGGACYGGGGGGGYSGGGGGCEGGGGGGGSYVDSSAITNLAEVSGIASPDGSPNGEIIIAAVTIPMLLSNVYFFDGTFSDTTWSTTVWYEFGSMADATVTYSQQTNGGNPGAYRSIGYVQTSGDSTETLVDLFQVAPIFSCNPQTQGAIQTFNFSMDRRASGDPWSAGVWPVVEQNGEYYIANPSIFPSSSWSSQLMTNLKQTSFIGIYPSLSFANPDFSTNGSPLTFGADIEVGYYNASPYSSQFTFDLDNFQVVVNPPTATVILSNLVQTYDGTAKSVSVTTVPPGLNVNVTYNGFFSAPTAISNYTVVAIVNDLHYQGGATNTLVINPIPTPALGMSTYSSQPAVFFPAALGTNYVLQMTTNLANGPWVTISNGIVISGLVITNPPANAYFRLH